ncbi:MAG: hypothetical protein JNM48_12400 [Rhodospirillales bacterium]|nr:hypothetical protein [Rhodospirillales bacterium]
MRRSTSGLRIACTLSVDVAAVCDAYGFPPATLAAERARLAPLAVDGLVRLDAGRLTVTDAGRPFVRVVAAIFDAYLQPRHSRAV